MKKIIHVLESIPATIVGGIFLIASFVFPKVEMEILGNLAWVTILISGTPLVYSAVKKLIRNKGISKISSALLISVAMIAAVLIDDLFAAAEVAFIMAIGEILEELTTGRAKKGLKKLINLAPTQGRIIRDGKEIVIPAEEIKQGDVIRILPGEAIPVDGIIISGETSVDQSVMTGESIPVDKSVNDEVFSGTINCFGSIDIKATKVGKNSSLQKLIQMVKDA
ncbi:MAG: cation-translocating P-type ATPase, partial [Treponema sp.]|nr:cation-translocating P-type ATPase [Treponema sp.]